MSSFNAKQLIQFMNKLMLEYADDIISVDRNEVIQFFKQQDIPCRDNYIEFLVRFGGNQSKFFGDYNCTFQEISEIYLEEPKEDLPPKNFCVIMNHTFADFFYIDYETGKICQDDFDLSNYHFGSIDEFLWLRLFFEYYEFFSEKTIQKMSSSELEEFFLDNTKKNLVNCAKNTGSLCGFNEAYLFKNNSIYVYFQNSGEIKKYKLNKEFINKLEELYRLK